MSTFDNTIKKLQELVNSNNMNINFRRGFVNYSKTTIEDMTKDIEDATNDVNVRVDKKLVDMVKALLSDIINYVVLENNNNFRSEFFELYILLTTNWNRLAKDESIAKDLLKLERLKNLTNSLVTLIEVSRSVAKKMERECMRKPPYYELSQHYLRTIKDSLK